MTSSSSSAKVCFNSNCKETSENWRRGWRRRTGEYADLCERCASVYEEGKFCETFHINASGWRCCESCGKQIHCGCIVSFHMFVLLDAGGIECITCARKSYILTPNPAWPPPPHFLPSQPERMKDLSVRSWSPIAGSGPVPWRQAPSLFSGSAVQSDSLTRSPFEVDLPDGIDRYRLSDRLSTSSFEKKQESSFEKLLNGELKIRTLETLENGNAGLNRDMQPSPAQNVSEPISFSKHDSSTPNLGWASASLSKIERNDDNKVSATLSKQSTVSTPTVKQLYSQNGTHLPGEPQVPNGRARGEVRVKNQLLPRYWPRITDKELQQISSDSNSVITPLFEKMLSASDAGRIGRLVLPKKCAEAYFPPISHPEGVPLKVQDSKGKEWVFQFRFWPNNNSRMYVLEGITPCIQSMQLQAGDVVTFSRLEPEGKLIMGCRKTSATSTDQGTVTRNEILTPAGSANSTRTESNDGHAKGKLVPSNFLSPNQGKKAHSVVRSDKSDHVAKELLESRPSLHTKKKNTALGSRNKRLRLEDDDVIELKFTCKQAQVLMRPSSNCVPTIFVVEGCEFEEFEEGAPVIGRPTVPVTDHLGEKIQWVQCEECCKWRKAPADVLLPVRWTCSDNKWDPERSSCSVAQESDAEQLEDILPRAGRVPARKTTTAKQDSDLDSVLEGLDALADLAIQGEGSDPPLSSQTRTRHPRHRPGCSCIVCIQPPSGQGPKHKDTCDCVLCSSVKRRFKTMMEKREKKLSEKDAETAGNGLQQHQFTEQESDLHQGGTTGLNKEEPSNGNCVYNLNEIKSSESPFKGQIDLNIQPEREEDSPPGSHSGLRRVLLDATERYFRQQGILSAGVNGNSATPQTPQDGGNFNNLIKVNDNGERTEMEYRMAISMDTVESTSSTVR